MLMKNGAHFIKIWRQSSNQRLPPSTPPHRPPQDMQNEITEALGANYATPDDIDESELMGELDALEDELTMESETGQGLPAYLQEPDLPSAPVPAHGQPQAVGADDDFGLPAVPAMPQRN